MNNNRIIAQRILNMAQSVNMESLTDGDKFLPIGQLIATVSASGIVNFHLNAQYHSGKTRTCADIHMEILQMMKDKQSDFAIPQGHVWLDGIVWMGKTYTHEYDIVNDALRYGIARIVQRVFERIPSSSRVSALGAWKDDNNGRMLIELNKRTWLETIIDRVREICHGKFHQQKQTYTLSIGKRAIQIVTKDQGMIQCLDSIAKYLNNNILLYRGQM